MRAATIVDGGGSGIKRHSAYATLCVMMTCCSSMPWCWGGEHPQPPSDALSFREAKGSVPPSTDTSVWLSCCFAILAVFFFFFSDKRQISVFFFDQELSH